MVLLVSLVLVLLSEMQPVEWKAPYSQLGTLAHIVIFIILFFCKHYYFFPGFVREPGLCDCPVTMLLIP